MAPRKARNSRENDVYDISSRLSLVYLSVFILGGLGCAARLGFQRCLPPESSYLPFGTILANLLGCLLIGFLSEALKKQSPLVRLAILTGALGGLTTLSSFAFELLNLLKDVKACVYWSTGSCFSLAMVWWGQKVFTLIKN